MGTSTKQKIRVRLRRFLPFWGILFLLFVWALFSQPYLVHHLVPFPTRQLVSFFPPWNQYDSYAGPVKNNAMPDVVTQIYPWKHFTIESLKHGKLPLWNPNNFAGNPALANFQTAIFSPFNLLYLILPFIDAWSITILMQPLLAGISMYLLLREFDRSKIGSVLGSISFMFCGFIVVWMAYGTLALAVSFLPLLLWSLERYAHKRSMWYLVVTSLTLTLSLFAGHFQTSLYVLLTAVGFIIYKAVTTKELKLILFEVVFLGIGFVLALPQLYPTIVFYGQSYRSNDAIVGGGIPLYYLITSFAPDFFGNPVTRNDWVGFYAERASFVGVIPFFLAGFSLFRLRPKGSFFFFLLAVISLVLSLDTPLLGLLGKSGIPVLSTSNPTRIIVLWSFALSVLAGYGYDQLLLILQKRALQKIAYVCITLLALVILIWSSILVFHLLPGDKAALAKRNFLLPSLFLVVIIGATVSQFFIARFKKYSFLPIVLIVLLTFDSLRFAQKWMPFDTTSLLFPDVPVISAMQKLEGNGRVFGNFGTEVQTYYGVPSLEGYDPLYIKRYGEFIKAATTGKYTLPDRSFVQIDRHAPSLEKLLNFMSVSLLFQPKSQLFVNYAYPVWGRPDIYKVAYEDDHFLLYANTQMQPFARLAYQYEVIPDSKKLLSRFYQPDFAYGKTILLEEKPSSLSAESTNATGSATVESVEDSNITSKVDSSAEGFLFIPIPYYPNWHATVNGKSTKIYLADYAFQAVKIPKGKSEVVFTYSYF